MNTAEWINKVLPGHDWDLKSQTNTIFGVAWKYDQDIKSKTGGDNDTFFSFKGLSENGKFTAADFGNYHAGYTGIAAGVSQRTQYSLAGLGEMAKFNGGFWKRAREILFNVSPNGNQRIDFHYNTDGMVDAAKAGLHP
ncbi:polymorphic toxin type 44 domain-containing protein [Mucilaginibacter lutimaris]|uniref:Polymorphic toxin type 44 domain-containing protein n=1 Tax=Mucilaginibacter lutimaris TaxID=931629 RepID=A0ABW2ZIS9_9SPHI